MRGPSPHCHQRTDTILLPGRISSVKRLLAALKRLISTPAIGPWLKDPNPAFDDPTPLMVIERGETDRIWRMVYELESGEPA